MKSFYLKVEARYSVKTEEVSDDGEVFTETNCRIKIWHSNEFDALEKVITFGNQFIDKNKWLAQYPGYIGQRLGKGYGGLLLGFVLKNGAQVFISVETHDTPEDFVNVLQFLNVEKIGHVGE